MKEPPDVRPCIQPCRVPAAAGGDARYAGHPGRGQCGQDDTSEHAQGGQGALCGGALSPGRPRGVRIQAGWPRAGAYKHVYSVRMQASPLTTLEPRTKRRRPPLASAAPRPLRTKWAWVARPARCRWVVRHAGLAEAGQCTQPAQGGLTEKPALVLACSLCHRCLTSVEAPASGACGSRTWQR